MKFKHRHRLRRKEIAQLGQEIEKTMGIDPFDGSEDIDRATTPEFDVLFLKGHVIAIIFEDGTILSIRGLLKFKVEKGFLTVDMGAVPYVINGADIMAPGIVDSDKELKPGSLAWIRDEKNLKPLAIVRLTKDGLDAISNKKGKAAKNLHYVGDKLWTE